MQSAIGFPDADFVIAVVAKGTLIITCAPIFQFEYRHFGSNNHFHHRATSKIAKLRKRKTSNHPIASAKPEPGARDEKGSDPDKGETKFSGAWKNNNYQFELV